MKRMILLWVGLVSCFCTPLFAAEIVKGNNTSPLDADASWVGGVVPGAGDVAVWNSTVSGANDSPLENDATWDGIKVTNPGGAVTVSGAGALTLDGGAATDINLSAATQDLTLAAPLAFTGTHVINVAAGRTLRFSSPISMTSTSWTRDGKGTVIFDGALNNTVSTDGAIDLRNGTNFFTGANGNILMSNGNLYVGRKGANNDATLIVSGGNATDRVTFIGLGGESTPDTGRLIMEGGTLRLRYLRMSVNGYATGIIDLNGGTIEILSGADTFNNTGCSFSMSSRTGMRIRPMQTPTPRS